MFFALFGTPILRDLRTSSTTADARWPRTSVTSIWCLFGHRRLCTTPRACWVIASQAEPCLAIVASETSYAKILPWFQLFAARAYDLRSVVTICSQGGIASQAHCKVYLIVFPKSCKSSVVKFTTRKVSFALATCIRLEPFSSHTQSIKKAEGCEPSPAPLDGPALWCFFEGVYRSWLRSGVANRFTYTWVHMRQRVGLCQQNERCCDFWEGAEVQRVYGNEAGIVVEVRITRFSC